MIVESFMWAVERYPRVRPTLWRSFYGALAAYSRRAEYWTFMNYGYLYDDSSLVPALAALDQVERYPIYLYHRVAARVDLKDRDVLEVGSGRGGGVSYLKRYLGARRVLGVDIAQSAIAFCRRVHRIDGVEFRQGDAIALPVDDASFDAVLNVESAHCYPSIERFLSEVRRVLRPGGHFLYADLHIADHVRDFERSVVASGLEVAERADISAGVAAALSLDSDRRKRWSEENAPGLIQRPVQAFIGVAGTRVPHALARGSTVYLAYVMRKPASTDRASERR
ncbi:MAG TPA: class I SAM-dependent methyltransferase [Roseiarcus sp.]|nr:class I SAM-dependent methyltransferase [Roseiarcus sp.]